MTDIKEPINTTSDGTFLSVVKTPKKVLLAKSWGGGGATDPSPPGSTPLIYTDKKFNESTTVCLLRLLRSLALNYMYICVCVQIFLGNLAN